MKALHSNDERLALLFERNTEMIAVENEGTRR